MANFFSWLSDTGHLDDEVRNSLMIKEDFVIDMLNEDYFTPDWNGIQKIYGLKVYDKVYDLWLEYCRSTSM